MEKETKKTAKTKKETNATNTKKKELKKDEIKKEEVKKEEVVKEQKEPGILKTTGMSMLLSLGFIFGFFLVGGLIALIYDLITG